MFKKNRKRLSTDEIEQAKERILEEYDHLIVKFMKPSQIKLAFLDRYMDAIKARIDMAHFFHAELLAVRELYDRETAKQQKNTSDYYDKIEKRNKKVSKENFADRIMEEHRQKIAKYPDVNFHADAASEIKKMVGVLQRIDQEYWPAIDDILRKSSATLYSNSRLGLEKKIYELASSNLQSASNRLASYINILGRFPRDYRSLEREGQLYLLGSAHFLHDLADELARMTESNNLSNDELIFVDKALDFVHTVIEDFRLVDLKPKAQ